MPEHCLIVRWLSMSDQSSISIQSNHGGLSCAPLKVARGSMRAQTENSFSQPLLLTKRIRQVGPVHIFQAILQLNSAQQSIDLSSIRREVINLVEFMILQIKKPYACCTKSYFYSWG